MRLDSPVLVSLVLSVALGSVQIAAQSAARPTIHRVTVQPDAGVLTITGTGLGPDFLVTVDGQTVTLLPGATGTHMDVQAPTAVLTTPGTYRLSVVDPVRQVGDEFVVASPPSANGDVSGAVLGEPLISGRPAPALELMTASRLPATAPQTTGGPSTLIIEDPGIPYTTAVGFQALAANVGGDANTAIGAFALRSNDWGGGNTASGYGALSSNTSGIFNTANGIGALTVNKTGSNNTASGRNALSNATGFANTAVGDSAGQNVVTGSYNVHLGASVVGTAADANTIRIGLPYDSGTGTGQNRAFIAGIHGTQLTGSYLQVVVDANGQLGTLTPPVQLSGGPAALVTPAAVEQQLEEQRAINADQQAMNAQFRATIESLLARLARLEAASRAPRGQ